jgi:hypothetical protein
MRQARSSPELRREHKLSPLPDSADARARPG